jgi:hypothetical protein
MARVCLLIGLFKARSAKVLRFGIWTAGIVLKDLVELSVRKSLPVRTRKASHIAFLDLEAKAEVAHGGSRMTSSQTEILYTLHFGNRALNRR